jgi:Tfp pilus assembly protein PilZ
MSVTDEERAYPRYEIDASADLTGSGRHRIQNISLGGICIQTRAIEEVGAPVDVVLHLGDDGARLDLHGQVVWVNREPPEDVGIRWTGLDDEHRSALAGYIDHVRKSTAET